MLYMFGLNKYKTPIFLFVVPISVAMFDLALMLILKHALTTPLILTLSYMIDTYFGD